LTQVNRGSAFVILMQLNTNAAAGFYALGRGHHPGIEVTARDDEGGRPAHGYIAASFR
jgi:hypothetical protein